MWGERRGREKKTGHALREVRTASLEGKGVIGERVVWSPRVTAVVLAVRVTRLFLMCPTGGDISSPKYRKYNLSTGI